MLKKPLSILSLISLGVLLLLVSLVLLAKLPNTHKNGFTRQFLPNYVNRLNHAPTTIPFTQLCGASSSNFFLSVQNPQWLIMMNKDLSKTTNYFIPIPKAEILRLHTVLVDSPNVALFANNFPALIRGAINGKRIDTVKLGASVFTRSAYIPPFTVIVRGFDSAVNKSTFRKISIPSGKITKEAALIESQYDFGLASDGFMQYDTFTHKILFVETYTNKIFCLDTNLNILYTGKTIDTVSSNPVAVKNVIVSGEVELVPASPRITVNQSGYVDRGRLYVNSALRADNEKIGDFDQNSVIDEYDIQTGNYIGSFYLPLESNEKLIAFLVQGHLLIGLYKTHVATFYLAR